MAKLTNEEISTFKIIRATFEEGKWVILASGENAFIYRAVFEGSESDDTATLLANTNEILLETEKYEPPTINQPIVRDDLNGLNLSSEL